MPRDFIQVNLRIHEPLRQRLANEAAASDRSFNAELLRRLEESFANEPEILELRAQAKQDRETIRRLSLALADVKTGARNPFEDLHERAREDREDYERFLRERGVEPPRPDEDRLNDLSDEEAQKFLQETFQKYWPRMIRRPK